MTYTPPPPGWVEVHIDPGAKAPNKQRFHVDRECGAASVAAALAQRAPDSLREIYLSGQMTYAQTRKLKNLSHCKCAKAHRVSHPVNERSESARTPPSTAWVWSPRVNEPEGHEWWRREPIPGSYLPVEELEDRRVYWVHGRRGTYGVWVAASRCFLVLGVEVNSRALIAEGHWDEGGTAWPIWRRKRSIKGRVAVVPPDLPLREGFIVPACLDGYYALK